MCGIAAIFNYRTDLPVNADELTKIRDAMAPRGPDGCGNWFSADRRVGLGNRRLAIIDLSEAGVQPMQNHDGSLTITFNGEIYNYRQLHDRLAGLGCEFRSGSDTEVLLHLYEREGPAMLTNLRGMFAFAIWDVRKRGLFLARDTFGIKPLYYVDNGSAFRLASQVKALLAGGGIDTAPEPAGHVGFFLWGHVPEPFTLYRGISALPAGHCMWVPEGGPPQLRSFSSVPELMAGAEKAWQNSGFQNDPTAGHRLTNIHRRLASALSDSVNHHLVADVPVGVFLSSGLDSTTLTALAARSSSELRTVTLGFEEFRGTAQDETTLAEQVASQYATKHQTIWITRNDFRDNFSRLITAMDQPTCDGVNSFFVSRAAAKAGLKVALSGLGGDELFGSYPSFHDIPRSVRFLKSFQSPALHRFNSFFRTISYPMLKRFTSPKYAGLFEYGGTYGGAYLLRRGMFMPWELPEILDPDLVREGWSRLRALTCLEATTSELASPRLRISALEMSWYMRHQLLRDLDWAGMHHSLEVRTPLVDVQLLRDLAPILASAQAPVKRDLALAVGVKLDSINEEAHFPGPASRITPVSHPLSATEAGSIGRFPLAPLPEAVLNRRKTGFLIPVRDWLMSDSQFPTRNHRPFIERGLRGWAREVYFRFHRTDSCLRARRPIQRKRLTAREVSTNVFPSVRILVLLSDGFGGFGGIAKFNRDLLTSMCSHPAVTEVVALPRLIPSPAGVLPKKLTYRTDGIGAKARYLRAVRQTMRESKCSGALNSGVDPFDLIVCGHIHLAPAALLAQTIYPAAVYLVVHGAEAWQPTKSLLVNWCVRRMDGFLAVSEVTRQRFARWCGMRLDQGAVLPNCVDLGDFSPGPKDPMLLRRYGLENRTVIMTLGRLACDERYKGFDEVIEILPLLAQEIPDIAYLIVGDGTDRARLEDKARSLGLVLFNGENSPEAGFPRFEPRNLRILDDRATIPPLPFRRGEGRGEGCIFESEVRTGAPRSRRPTPSCEPSTLNPARSQPQVVFAGRIPEAEKADHYRLADAYVMPSRGEGFGIALLEAMACGIPVVASKIDGTREALRDGQLGVLVDPDNPSELRHGILSALTPNRRASPNGLQFFSVENFRCRVNRILEQLLPFVEKSG